MEIFLIGNYSKIKKRDTLNNINELRNNIPLLEQKIAIMSIITLFFGLNSNERRLPITSLCERLERKIEEVEILLMRSMSLGFIKGNIDQVAGFVEVEWVQPRVLDLNQIESMGNRFNDWIKKVDIVLTDMESGSYIQ